MKLRQLIPFMLGSVASTNKGVNTNGTPAGTGQGRRNRREKRKRLRTRTSERNTDRKCKLLRRLKTTC